MISSIIARLGLDSTGFNKGLKEAQAESLGFAGRMKQGFSAAWGGITAGVAAFAGVGLAAKKFADICGDAVDAAARFNTSVEVIQKVDYVAQQAGTSVEEVGKVFNQLAVAAANGSDEFEKVGINAKQFLNLDMDGRLELLAKAYEDCNGDQAKMAQLLELVGGKGSKVFPMLTAGAQGVRNAMGEIIPVSTEVAESMDYLGDRIEYIKRLAISAAAAVVSFVERSGKAIGQGLYEATGGQAPDIMLDDAKQEADRKAARENKPTPPPTPGTGKSTSGGTGGGSAPTDKMAEYKADQAQFRDEWAQNQADFADQMQGGANQYADYAGMSSQQRALLRRQAGDAKRAQTRSNRRYGINGKGGFDSQKGAARFVKDVEAGRIQASPEDLQRAKDYRDKGAEALTPQNSGNVEKPEPGQNGAPEESNKQTGDPTKAGGTEEKGFQDIVKALDTANSYLKTVSENVGFNK